MAIDRTLNYGRQHIRKFLQLSMPYSTVVDLGAGRGADLLIAKELNPGCSLYGVEYYEPNLVALRQKGINIIQNNIESSKFDFPNESVDVVIANQILEHTKELYWIFHEMSRILAVNGHLIIGVPNLASLHNRLLLLLGLQPTSIRANSAHIRGFTKSDFLLFLESCFAGGFQFKAFGGGNFYPFPPFIAKPMAQLLPNMAWGIFLLFEKKKCYDKQFLEFPVKQMLETNFFLGK